MATKKSSQVNNFNLRSPMGMVLFALAFALVGYGIRVLTHASPAINTSGSSIKLNEADPYLGSIVTYTTKFPRLSNPINKNQPMIETDCYQDVNNDGTVDTTRVNGQINADLVYGSLTFADSNYQKSLTGITGDLLGGGASLWKTRGGAATCNSTLFYYQKGTGQNVEQYVFLATTGNWQAGAAR